ncbi:MAG: hypothetical protein H6710_19520 [Myxococcales bacterium]|nr:hypothetical protein [Myxococcales bacterium]MCB9702324.1 hypothetical protein [Myxococcales bacterium]
MSALELTMDGFRTPREQGVNAARRGEARQGNPFPRESEAWHAWMEGFAWARSHYPERARGRAPSPPPVRRPAMVAWPSLR